MARLPADFQRLLAAQAVSNVGDGLVLVAMPLLATHYTKEPLLVAGAAVAQGLPWLLFSLPAGVLVDRVDRRRLMVAADAVRAVLMLAFGFLVLTGQGGIVAVYVVAFAMSTAETLYVSAVQSITPQLVGSDDEALDAANGRLEATSVTGQEFLGPALGGVLFGVAMSSPFLLDSLSFAASAVLLVRMRGRFRAVVPGSAPESGTRRVRGEMAEGFRWVWRQPVLRLLGVTLAALAFLQGSMWGLLALYAREELAVPVQVFGVLWAVAAIGDLVGGLATGRLRRRLGAGRTVQLATLVVGFGYLVMGTSGHVATFTVGLAVVGLAIVTAQVVITSLRQRLTPEHLLGRVSATYRLVTSGMDPLGALAGGVLAHVVGLRAPFLVAGVLQVVLALTVVPLLVRRLAGAGPASADAAQEDRIPG